MARRFALIMRLLVESRHVPGASQAPGMSPMIFWVGLLLTVVIGLAACQPSYRFKGIPYDNPKSAPNLPLTMVGGDTFSWDKYQNKVVLIYFGYTSCPDVCPITLAQFTQVWRQLDADHAMRFQPVFVTVDPERDTEDVMTRYLGAFDRAVADDRGLRFIGLRGMAEQLAPVLADFEVTVQKRPQPNSAVEYTVDHTASVYVVDPRGNLVERLPYGTPIDDILSDVRYLLK